MTIQKYSNKDLIGVLKETKSEFISYYERGLAETKWHRSFSMYLYWAFLYNNDPKKWQAFDIYCKTCDCLPNKNDYYKNDGSIVEESYEIILHRFDLSVRLVKNWVFS